MKKLFIETQIQENYGIHDWDGTGDVPQYWKNKGGNTYFITVSDDYLDIDAPVDTALLASVVERDDIHFKEWIINTHVESTDYLTDDEKNQLEYEGKITYPSVSLDAEHATALLERVVRRKQAA